MIRFSRLLATLLLLSTLSPAASADPRQRHIILTDYTTLTADIVPGLGTRFIFPFVLDKQDRDIPFTLVITNPAVFVSHRDPGRNSFVVTTPENLRSGHYYGFLYVTVAGYEISIELRTTSDRAHDASDVIFELSRKPRENLIQQAVARRTRDLETTYRQRLAEVDHRIDERAIARIGTLALHPPKYRRIEEEERRNLKDGDDVVLYVNKSLSFGPYTVIAFDVHNGSYDHGLTVKDAKLFSLDARTAALTPIDAADMLPDRIAPRADGRGTVTVVGADLNPANRLRLQVLTDKTGLEAQW